MLPANWENVLVVQTSFLGDTVLTLPLLSEIKRRYPAGKLTLLCAPVAAELLGSHEAIDEVLIDDKRRQDAGVLGLWRKAKVLEQKRFTLAISPHKSLRSALLLFLARIPRRVGFRQSQGAFLFHDLADRNPGCHDVERNLSILQPLGIPTETCRRDIDLPVAEAAREQSRHLLQALGVDLNKTVIGINAGSVWPTKRWAPDLFARLITKLKQNLNCEIVLFGGPEDHNTVATIQALCETEVVNLSGKTALRDLPAAISACDLFITNDSGPMHIAVGCGVPVVAIFCATTPSLGFYPYSSKAVVVQKELPCRPCSSHGGRRCPLGTEDCIKLIRPEEVLQAAIQMLQVKDRMPPDSSTHAPQYLNL
ncbi:MAG TPA: lipopolysaccharide heptosyltransferase II [Candidatus Binatia bacterium]